jgi:transcriptional regulator GlxA family with amidase domain
MIDCAEQREIGLVLYPGAQLAAVQGLTDLFNIANRFHADMMRSQRAPLRITHWNASENEISCLFSSEPEETPKPGILILPPTLGSLPDVSTCEAIGRWLVEHHARGVSLVTICSGIFLVAPTGLLDGKMVSTHRICAPTLRDNFPNIGVDVEQRMIEHPDILTAGGFMAWVDVAFVLIERLLGEFVRAQTAHFVLSGHSAAMASRFNACVSSRKHGDSAVQRAQEFVHMRDGQGISLQSMASAAHLERRTLFRRFRNATGMTPIEYCRAVRTARARELLEGGDMPLKEVAESLGYVDASSFARAFRNSHGVPPGAYRKQHAGALEMQPAMRGIPASKEQMRARPMS